MSSDNVDHEAPAYGATSEADASGGPFKRKSPAKRIRMNSKGILMAVMVPWLVYCHVFAARTFSIRNTSSSKGILLICLLVVLTCFGLAFSQIQKKQSGHPGYEPMWYIFLAITTLLAWLHGLGSGEYNYNTNMVEFFGYAGLNEYSNIDPALMRGTQMMDAGTVEFINASFVDAKYSAGFSNSGMYCVAPITSVQGPLASYDFWAVGMDCCTGSSNSFRCGNNINTTHSGLRLLQDSYRAYYHLAVQKAQATYGIWSDHPLFFHWVADPSQQKTSSYQAGWDTFMLGIFAYLFFQCFLVVIALIFFSKPAS